MIFDSTSKKYLVEILFDTSLLDYDVVYINGNSCDLRADNLEIKIKNVLPFDDIIICDILYKSKTELVKCFRVCPKLKNNEFVIIEIGSMEETNKKYVAFNLDIYDAFMATYKYQIWKIDSKLSLCSKIYSNSLTYHAFVDDDGKRQNNLQF
jgi:hypothetical protein